MVWETPPLSQVRAALTEKEPASTPIGMRMRAAYYLRHYYQDSNATVVTDTLAQGLLQPAHGSLLRHEFAYVMGQIQDTACVGALEQVLADATECVMVRHEAAEALGALGEGRAVLESIVGEDNTAPIELVDTCRLSLSVMEWKQNPSNHHEAPVGCACMLNPYSSVDPAPPHPEHVNVPTIELGEILRNSELDLFERYRALFSLRNRGGDDAVQELCRTLLDDTSSALLRHEVAYVLGQMQNPNSVEALAESLGRKSEHFMVRHESAEALGAIEDRWTEVETILRSYLDDEDVVVRESCAVALDAADYWGRTTEESEGFAALKATRDEHFNILPSNHMASA